VAAAPVEAAGGELDGEWDAVQTVADLGDGGGVLPSHGEAGEGGFGAVNKQADGLVLGDLLHRRGRAWVGRWEAE